LTSLFESIPLSSQRDDTTPPHGSGVYFTLYYVGYYKVKGAGRVGARPVIGSNVGGIVFTCGFGEGGSTADVGGAHWQVATY
jgi:hypothetical protein